MPNMRVLKRSRKRPRVGDVFAFQILDGKYHWGRVVSVSAKVGGFDNCLLVYIYRTATDTTEKIPNLRTTDLLLGPVATNAQPWSRGYFQFVENQKLDLVDLLQTHCFKAFNSDKFFDDRGDEVSEICEPVGEFGLDSYLSIDDKVSEALGLQLAPEH